MELSRQYTELEDEFRTALQIESARFQQVSYIRRLPFSSIITNVIRYNCSNRYNFTYENCHIYIIYIPYATYYCLCGLGVRGGGTFIKNIIAFAKVKLKFLPVKLQ